MICTCSNHSDLGVKGYALVMMQYISQYIVHDMILSKIHLLNLAGKQRPTIPACDQEHQYNHFLERIAISIISANLPMHRRKYDKLFHTFSDCIQGGGQIE